METLYDPTSFLETGEVPTPTDEELELFKQQVSEWMKLDDQVRKLSIAIRERRTHQRALASKIQDFMIKYNYDNLSTQTGRIKSQVRVVKQPLRIQEIRDKILSLQGLSGEDLVSKIFDEERPSVEKRSLRRVIPKVSLRLDI